MKVSCEHIASNCSIAPNCLQFLDINTIAYSFSNQIAIYSLPQNNVSSNINNRLFDAERVVCIKSFKIQGIQYIIGGYDSGHLVTYMRKEDKQWDVREIIKQDSAIISIFFNQHYLITNNNSAQITYYTINNQKNEKQSFLQSKQVITFPLNKIINTLSSFILQDHIILFLAGVDKQIYCYAKKINDQNSQFTYCFFLAGHQNAIMKIQAIEDGQDFLLSSCSQDGYIRVWRITSNNQLIKFHKNVKNLLKNHKVFLDSVLISHECSVTCVKWAKFNGLQLISCSLDCTICIWDRDEQGAWSVGSRMGQFLGNKNAYFNVVVDHNSKYLVAVNYIGSAMIWEHDKQGNKFSLRPSFNGHSNEVRDLDWNHTGDFLVSVSKDQTTRVIAKGEKHYHEISRAQVHGYDINAVSTLKVKDNLIDLIVCGADEKVLRVVEPPASFANYLNTFTKTNLHLFFPSEQEQNKYLMQKGQGKTLLYETYAEGGTQVLGLMTKMQRVERQKITSYYEDEEEEGEMQEDSGRKNTKEEKIDFQIPPHDDYLVKHTLWPQMNKLYGHPHEISCLTKSYDGKKLASACNGLSKAASTILVWDTKDWRFKPIQHHSYTVYDMKYSFDNKYLASVSKDRKLALFDENNEVVFSYEAHSRAILSVSFNTSSSIIATGSRDKTIKIHSIKDKKIISEFALQKIAYSLAFCSQKVLACGCDDGTITFLKWNPEENELNVIYKIQDKFGSTKPISSLAFSKGRLASASFDHSVRVFSIDFGFE